MDMWTAIDRSYVPGANEVAKSLVDACKKCGAGAFEDLLDPKKVTGRMLSDNGASDEAVHLATALVLLKGASYDHLMT